VADKFLNRTSTRLLATTFQRWQQVFTSHQNALAYATTYDQAHLQSRMLLAWRMKLHDRLRLAKVARWANRYFVTRSALRVWIGALEDKRRERKLRDFEVAKLRKVFDGISFVPNLPGDELNFFQSLEMSDKPSTIP
jgi:protein SFI1